MQAGKRSLEESWICKYLAVQFNEFWQSIDDFRKKNLDTCLGYFAQFWINLSIHVFIYKVSWRSAIASATENFRIYECNVQKNWPRFLLIFLTTSDIAMIDCYTNVANLSAFILDEHPSFVFSVKCSKKEKCTRRLPNYLIDISDLLNSITIF